MSVKKLVTTNIALSVEHAILHELNSFHRDLMCKSDEYKKIECFCCKNINENKYYDISSCREF